MDNPTTGKLGYIAWLVIIVLVILFSMKVDTFIDTRSGNSRQGYQEFRSLIPEKIKEGMCAERYIYSTFLGLCTTILQGSEATYEKRWENWSNSVQIGV